MQAIRNCIGRIPERPQVLMTAPKPGMHTTSSRGREATNAQESESGAQVQNACNSENGARAKLLNYRL